MKMKMFVCFLAAMMCVGFAASSGGVQEMSCELTSSTMGADWTYKQGYHCSEVTTCQYLNWLLGNLMLCPDERGCIVCEQDPGSIKNCVQSQEFNCWQDSNDFDCGDRAAGECDAGDNCVNAETWSGAGSCADGPNCVAAS